MGERDLVVALDEKSWAREIGCTFAAGQQRFIFGEM
jgi:hypothetical protein